MGSPKLIDLPRAPDAIELRHLRAFVAVAEELNFSRAATRMYVTQPALSRQIQALERLLGVDLLRRSTQRVELTIAGESLLGRSRSLLSDVDEAVQATRSVAGRLDAEVVRLAQPLADTLATGGLDAFREAYEAMNAQLPSPTEIQARPVNAGGTPSLVYGVQGGDGPTVLYLHGGGYVVGSAFGYRPLAGTVAALSGTSVLVPDYRLAPEHTYPAALDDAAAAYDWLLSRVADPADIAFVGDSSGGGLAMGLLLRLRDRGQPLPGRVALLSPWVDLRPPTPEQVAAAGAGPAQLIEIATRYGGLYLDGHPADDPLVNPMCADLSGLPPILAQAAGGDWVAGETRELVERVRAAGGEADLELYPVNTHVFHMFWSFLPEAVEALESAGRFVAASR